MIKHIECNDLIFDLLQFKFSYTQLDLILLSNINFVYILLR